MAELRRLVPYQVNPRRILGDHIPANIHNVRAPQITPPIRYSVSVIYFCLCRGSLTENTAGRQPRDSEPPPTLNFGKKLYVSQNHWAGGLLFAKQL